MRAVYTHFKYVTGSTQIHATAEEALKLGEGVCQDYAHIMLSLLRIEGIPCRYVVGIMQGEGASHAWTEVLCNGYWYGFDPTNNKLVDDEYIKSPADVIPEIVLLYEASLGVWQNKSKQNW